jgi:hypothetical protein
VDKTKGHKAYLVLNGEITDEVRYLIDHMNADNQRRDRRVAYLDVITVHGLLQDFISAQGQFLPTTVGEVGMLLDVYNADGTDFLPTDRVFRFFEGGLFADAGGVSKQLARNAIAASVITTGYLLQAFQRAKNAFALFEGWTILAGCMIRYAHRAGLQSNDWHASLELVRAAINASLQDLWTEVAPRTDFLEGNALVDGAELYRARVTIVLGALSAFALCTPDFEAPSALRSFLVTNRRRFWLWGESAFPFLYSIAKYMESGGDEAAGIELLTEILDGTIAAFTNLDTQELAPPYYSAKRILSARLQLGGADQTELLSSGGSFILRPTLDLLARRDARDAVASRWKRVSKVPAREVRPTEMFELFTWRMTSGTNLTEILPATQSWAALRQGARQRSPTLDALRAYSDLLLYFILVCPHRATSDVMKLIDIP